jgi:hypothetical protein
MNASELFFNVRAKGGDVIMGMDGEIEKFAGSPELVSSDLPRAWTFSELREFASRRPRAFFCGNCGRANSFSAQNPYSPKRKALRLRALRPSCVDRLQEGQYLYAELADARSRPKTATGRITQSPRCPCES